MSTPTIGATPCPRCGCHLVSLFECNCGEVHGDYCVNCGRSTSLSPSEHVNLSPVDVRCDAGPVIHEHSEEEKGKRIAAWIAGLKRAN